MSIDSKNKDEKEWEIINNYKMKSNIFDLNIIKTKEDFAFE
jgi:hypothetical protein